MEGALESKENRLKKAIKEDQEKQNQKYKTYNTI